MPYGSDPVVEAPIDVDSVLKEHHKIHGGGVIPHYDDRLPHEARLESAYRSLISKRGGKSGNPVQYFLERGMLEPFSFLKQNNINEAMRRVQAGTATGAD